MPSSRPTPQPAEQESSPGPLSCQSGDPPRPWLAPMLGVFLVLVALTLWVSPEQAWSDPLPDSVEYVVSAQRLLRTGSLSFVVNGELHPTRYQPGFPVLFLAPLYALVDQAHGSGIYAVWASGVLLALLLWLLAQRLAPGWPGVACAALAFASWLQMTYFAGRATQIMSDLPALMLGVACAGIYQRAARAPAVRDLLLGGLLTAIATSLRMTCLAYGIPFLFLAVRAQAPRWRALCAVAAPMLAGLCGLGLYNASTFGAPAYTGYHYWLEPEVYALTTRDIWANLVELTNPFLPPSWIRRPGQAWLGPLSLTCIAGLGLACSRWRPQRWKRSRPLLHFALMSGLPLLTFHLAYPFPSARFALLPHALALALGWAWLLALLPGKPAILAAIAGCAWIWATPLPTTPWSRRTPLHVLSVADELLPQDAILISDTNGLLIQEHLLEGSERSHLPLHAITAFGGPRRVKLAGESGRLVFPFDAVGAPDQVQALMDQRRPVYLELPPRVRSERAAVESFRSQFRLEVIWTDPMGLRSLARLGPAPIR